MTQMQYVPENQTDYIFSVAGEELGFLGCPAYHHSADGADHPFVLGGVPRLYAVFGAVAVGVSRLAAVQTFMNTL